MPKLIPRVELDTGDSTLIIMWSRHKLLIDKDQWLRFMAMRDETHGCTHVQMNRAGYAHFKIERDRAMWLHRWIIDAPEDMHVDHINHLPWDNRESNLRLATRSQNMANSSGRKTNTGFRGVRKRWHKYESRITHNGTYLQIGRYDTAEEGARAYDAKALELHGPFATLNFPI